MPASVGYTMPLPMQATLAHCDLPSKYCLEGGLFGPPLLFGHTVPDNRSSESTCRTRHAPYISAVHTGHVPLMLLLREGFRAFPISSPRASSGVAVDSFSWAGWYAWKPHESRVLDATSAWS